MSIYTEILDLEMNGGKSYYIPADTNDKSLMIKGGTVTANCMLEVFRIDTILGTTTDKYLTRTNGTNSDFMVLEISPSTDGVSQIYPGTIDGTGKIAEMLPNVEEGLDITLDKAHDWIIQLTLLDDTLAVDDMGHLKLGITEVVDIKPSPQTETGQGFLRGESFPNYTKLHFSWYSKEPLGYYVEYRVKGRLKRTGNYSGNGVQHNPNVEPGVTVALMRDSNTDEELEQDPVFVIPSIGISTVEELEGIGGVTGPMWMNYILLNDIDCTSIPNFTPIGTQISPFTGWFNGDEFEIQTLIINVTNFNIGLFKINDGTIRNIYIDETSSITNTLDVNTGSLVGRNETTGTIRNCYSKAIVTGNDNVGGLVGWNDGGIIEDSYGQGDINGVDRIGGMVGRNDGTLTNCYGTGNILGINRIGGLVGNNINGGTITDSYATGNADGQDDIGGLVGYNNNDGIIKHSYATGNADGEDAIGGLIGSNSIGGIITDSYSTGDVSGTTNVGKSIGLDSATSSNIASYEGSAYAGDGLGFNGIELTAAQLNDKTIHDDLLNISEINFDTTKVNSGFYPWLYKQGTTEHINGQTDNTLPV